MSAQQIPNLLSGRGGPRARGGRGRGRGQGVTSADHGGPSHGTQHRNDSFVQSTDTDAAVSRLSAVSLGYLSDPYAPYFVNGPGTRRLPIINRGTYTRTAALDILIDEFLAQPMKSSPQTKQIISLGAGTDTRYFRLRSQNKHQNLIYHEFDFPSVCDTKRQIILNNRIFSGSEDDSLFPSASGSSPSWQGKEGEWGFERLRNGKAETVYCCHPLDLRNLPSLHEIPRGLRMDVPTLLISECCLCYLSVNDSRDVVKWFIVRIPSLGIVLYEPIGVDDSFGQMMVSNLAARNITMPSLKSFKTLDDQKSRLSELGFRDENSGQDAETVENIWDYWVPAAEKQRVDGLEGLDEVEEWQMLARHYAIIWGWRGTTGWEGWTTVRENR